MARGLKFVFVFGYDDPTYYPSPGVEIELAHLVFGDIIPQPTVFVRSTARGLSFRLGLWVLRPHFLPQYSFDLSQCNNDDSW